MEANGAKHRPHVPKGTMQKSTPPAWTRTAGFYLDAGRRRESPGGISLLQRHCHGMNHGGNACCALDGLGADIGFLQSLLV